MGYVPRYDYETHDPYDMEPMVTDLQELPKGSQGKGLETIRELLSSTEDFSFNVSGGHVYERKGYLSADSLGGPRNSSYGSNSDDVLLQVTIRVRPRVAEKLIDNVKESILQEELEIEAEERRRLDAELAALDAKRDELNARRDQIARKISGRDN